VEHIGAILAPPHVENNNQKIEADLNGAATKSPKARSAKGLFVGLVSY
jgi:hypothetical protein